MENKLQENLEDQDLRKLCTTFKLSRLKRKLLTGVVIALVVILIFTAFLVLKHKYDKLKTEYDEFINAPILLDDVAPTIKLDVISSEIKALGELTTAEYFYTNSAVFSDSKQIKNWNIPLTKKSFIIKWNGVIKAGVDMEQIIVRANESSRTLTISLPSARILSHDPDTESVEILDEKDGLFNPVRLEDKSSFDVELEKEMENRAIESGLLEKAQKNAEFNIAELLYKIPDIKKHYSIVFETLQP